MTKKGSTGTPSFAERVESPSKTEVVEATLIAPTASSSGSIKTKTNDKKMRKKAFQDTQLTSNQRLIPPLRVFSWLKRIIGVKAEPGTSLREHDIASSDTTLNNVREPHSSDDASRILKAKRVNSHLQKLEECLHKYRQKIENQKETMKSMLTMKARQFKKFKAIFERKEWRLLRAAEIEIQRLEMLLEHGRSLLQEALSKIKTCETEMESIQEDRDIKVADLEIEIRKFEELSKNFQDIKDQFQQLQIEKEEQRVQYEIAQQEISTKGQNELSKLQSTLQAVTIEHRTKLDEEIRIRITAEQQKRLDDEESLRREIQENADKLRLEDEIKARKISDFMGQVKAAVPKPAGIPNNQREAEPVNNINAGAVVVARAMGAMRSPAPTIANPVMDVHLALALPNAVDFCGCFGSVGASTSIQCPKHQSMPRDLAFFDPQSQVLGKGGFGSVFCGKVKAQHVIVGTTTSQTLAVKVLKLGDDSDKNSLLNEIEILDLVSSHLFIPTYHGIVITPNDNVKCLVMDHMAGGTLDKLRQNP
ncbi:hypothetical protein HDU76_013406 [Blyttiomyces sp. JEL0837]|nr:hypothetical protein HDU76_013406 [Blyttiomyces sp. JEL0837]